MKLSGAANKRASASAQHTPELGLARLQLLRDIPFTAIFWSITEPTRRKLSTLLGPEADSRHGPAASTLLLSNAAAAGSAGAVAAAATTPLDVIKTQQQIAPQSATLWATARRIHQRSGAGGFLAGVWPRSVRAVPAAAIVVSTYEMLKWQFASSLH